MKKIFHKSEDRGLVNHGWLKAAHSFSFASYYDREKVNFGKLRVLNDDIVAPARGFDLHQHQDMEIITIPIHGSLEHRDSMGNGSVITSGEIQNMSAGTGITHSEFNPMTESEVNLLQIWIFPKTRDVNPRYGQLKYNNKKLENNIVNFVSPVADETKLWINQDAWISLSRPLKGTELVYQLNKEGNGVYLFVIDGEVELGNQKLGPRDALGLWDTDSISIVAGKNSFLLLLDIPMSLD